jgi:hypothetical protein
VRRLGIRETWSWLLVELRGRESLAGSITVDPLLYSPRPAQMDVRASDVARLLGQEEAYNGNGIVGHAGGSGVGLEGFSFFR